MSQKIIKSGTSLQQFIGDVIKEVVSSKRRLVEADDKEVLSSGEITVKEIVEKLNIIRSGRSLKDSEVKQSMEQYVDGLDSAEKTALFSFLKGISEIVTAGVEGEEAMDPGDKPANVRMEKKPTDQKIKLKTVFVKKPENEEKSTSKKEEDTTPPIKVTK